MKRIYLLFLIFILLALIPPAQNHATSFQLEIPALKEHEELVRHRAFCLTYNEEHEQANWIAYQLTKEETNSKFSRNNKFITDPLIKSGSAENSDYAGSGYDRGHLAPAADMGWSELSMKESFYFSNMSPQDPGFNRGVWKRLEEMVRTWAIEYDSVYVVTGPILKPGLSTIGPNKVSVPQYYYKVILQPIAHNSHGIGFIMSNTGSSEMLQNFAVTIDSVEKISGIDFFPSLEYAQEEKTESGINLDYWTWKKIKPVKEIPSNEGEGLNTSKHHPDTSNIKEGTSNQCHGTTNAGKRCKRTTTSPNGKCWQHGGD